MPKSEVQIDLGTTTINCTIEEIEATFAWLLVEMHAAIPRLRPDERAVLRRIMANESGSLTVSDVFPKFTRESEGHKTLRRLRAGQFIRPAKTGRWEPNERIELKPFGWLVWNRCGEAALFNDGTVSDPVPEHYDAGDDVVLDLASPDVNDLEAEAAMLLKDGDVANWDDDLLDVQDFANDSKDRRA
jgi:hypothetical protein